MKVLKSIWNYIFDIDGARTESTISKSITGKPLTKCKSDMYGWSIWNTDEGIYSGLISVTITQFGNNVDIIKNLLLGELDDYVTSEQKVRYILKIQELISEGGSYLTTVRNYEGNLDFVRVPWEESDLNEIKSLMERFHESDS